MQGAATLIAGVVFLGGALTAFRCRVRAGGETGGRRGAAQAAHCCRRVTGDAAMAKVELDYPTVFFTDYFTLLKIDGKWKIVNKTFHARRKAS